MPEHDAPILTALSRAFHWQRLIDEGIVSSGSDIARREGLHQTTVNELLRLTLLSPTLVRSILDGKQPKTLSLLWLKNNFRFPDPLLKPTGTFCFFTPRNRSVVRRFLDG